MENKPIVRLNFTCNRNWEEMTPVAGGRFCNDCQKKVVDFTDKTNEEIAAYLMSSTDKVCGRFTSSQLAFPLPKPVWKRWLSAAAMFAAVFMGIKEASAQTTQLPVNKTDYLGQYNRFIMGEVIVASYVPEFHPQQKIYALNEVEALPLFPAGEKAFISYLFKNIRVVNATSRRITLSFVVEKDGTLTNIKILRSGNTAFNNEVIRVLKESPKWNPGMKDGKVINVAYTLPIIFN